MRSATGRRGLTLIELLIVMFIVAGLLGLLVPAVLSARSSSRRMTCQNNVRQQSIALGELWRVTKELPAVVRPGFSGGWTVAILPLIEERALADQLQPSRPMRLSELPTAALMRPLIMTCPSVHEVPSTTPSVAAAHYAIATGWNRETWNMGDAPLSYSTPWCAGPEIPSFNWESAKGPHEGGFNITQADGSVEFRLPANITPE